MVAGKGNRVKVEYEGTLEDGSVFDSSKAHGSLLEFELGAKQMIPGFENAVIGMKKNEEKKVTLKPSEAYGEADPLMTKEVPKTQLPPDLDVKVGMTLAASLPEGGQLPATVVEVNEDAIIIDLNHPLAGKTLTFKIKVVEISS
ncbi:MAG: peptidylprolyl isomerase [Candidatus Diapherotrites archaeon]|nr:peptidylprolyl isomerase [Candidatus Diapherotrites archaeon]